MRPKSHPIPISIRKSFSSHNVLIVCVCVPIHCWAFFPLQFYLYCFITLTVLTVSLALSFVLSTYHFLLCSKRQSRKRERGSRSSRSYQFPSHFQAWPAMGGEYFVFFHSNLSISLSSKCLFVNGDRFVSDTVSK